MADELQVEILKQGPKAWNKWRKQNSAAIEDANQRGYIYLNLNWANLRRADLSGADLSFASFNHAHLKQADLSRANLAWASFHEATLTRADLSEANLYKADLSKSNLDTAYLNKANLTACGLWGTNLAGATVSEADFTEAFMGVTQLGDVDLSSTLGLESVHHGAPSSLGIDTLFRSQGKIPEAFLLGCGVPEELITYARSLVIDPVQYNSCFISYNTKDEEFAYRLHSRLRDKNLRVWYAPKDVRGGQKLHEQIDQAIQMHDRLLLILSPQSINSGWVKTEIIKAHRRERKEQRRILFPVSLFPYEELQAWQFITSDGHDLAEELRAFYIPDFTHWKDHDAFEGEFKKLLRDLKANQ